MVSGGWAGGAGSGGVVADQLGVDGDLCCGVGLWMLDVGTWGGGGVCWMRWTTCCSFLFVADCIFVGCCCGGIGWCWE